jgi:hypothetical protein
MIIQYAVVPNLDNSFEVKLFDTSKNKSDNEEYNTHYVLLVNKNGIETYLGYTKSWETANKLIDSLNKEHYNNGEFPEAIIVFKESGLDEVHKFVFIENQYVFKKTNRNSIK